MQEEEKNAVTPTEAAETPEQPERSIAEEPAEGSETADAAKTAAEDTAEISETAPEEVPAEPEDKIRAIRTSLFHIAQEEEEEAVTQRVAQQIRQVKDQKEHPEKYPPPPMPPKPRKQTFGQKMLGLFPQRGDSGGEVVRKSIFLFSATVFLVCMVRISCMRTSAPITTPTSRYRRPPQCRRHSLRQKSLLKRSIRSCRVRRICWQ